MRWSWRIARVAGIGIFVHATFPILLAYIALDEYGRSGTVPATIAAVAFILALFAIVVLHELGHALAARRYGIATRDITLLPIGGVARLERMPREPRQELVIALAGPAVNLALAPILFGVLWVTGGIPSAAEMVFGGGLLSWRVFLARLAWTNLFVLAAFNLIPAFPMDGGRVLRALLAIRSRNYARATEIAARVGRLFALAFGIAGWFWLDAPVLVLIALFVWLGAAGEAAAVQQSDTLDGVLAAHVMIRDVRTLGPGDPLGRAIQHTLESFQQDFPVVDGGAVVGVLTRRDLFRVLAERGPTAPVHAAMRRDLPPVDPDDEVEVVLARLRGCGCQALPVVRDGRLLGVLSLDNVSEFVMARTALRESRG
jgi:Zn-dependent protease/CBS domain-containing protein